MIRKTIIIIAFFSITRIVISCCNGVEPGFSFNYSRISLTSGDKIVKNILNQADSALYSDLIIQIDFDYTKITQIGKKSSFDLCAFDCRALYDLENKIKDLKVITIGDFNEQHLNGSELEVNYKIEGYDMNFTGSKDFVIHDLNNEGDGSPNARVFFKFKNKPETNGFHRFAYNIQFNDNTQLTDTTKLIYIEE